MVMHVFYSQNGMIKKFSNLYKLIKHAMEYNENLREKKKTR